MVKPEFLYKDTGRTGVEYTGRNAHDTDCVAKYPFGAGGGFGSGALSAAERNVRVGILQETDITDGIHTRCSVGYFIWVTEAENRHWGGIAVL